MSHGDEVVRLPKGFIKLANTKDNNIAAVGNLKKNIYGLRFIRGYSLISGKIILENFYGECNIKENWN